MEWKEILAEILQIYLFPILLMAFGVFLLVIGLGSRDEQVEQAGKATERAKSDRDDDRAQIKIGSLIIIPSPLLPRWLRFALMMVGSALIVIGVLYIGLNYKPPSTLTISPSLISLRYEVDNFDPRIVDLRTASSSGIPVRSGQALQLLDVWVWVPQDAPEYGVQAEVYVKDQFIGFTSSEPLLAGPIQLGDVTVKDFHHGDYADAWRVQEDWTDLTIVLVTVHGNKVMGSTRTTIHLDPSGMAWLLDPPDLSFASVVYTINDGPVLVLDLRDADEAGFDIRPGDVLTLREIWYHSNMSSGDTVQAQAYLTLAGFDLDTYKATRPNPIQEGFHALDFTPLSWSIPDDKDKLVLSLVRSNGVVMDRLVLPLRQGSPGLVRRSEAVLWPFEQVEYVDFESPADLDEWTDTEFATVTQSSGQAFTGGYALAVTTTGMGDTEESKILTHWKHPFQAQVIIGQVYWPRQEGVKLIWAQACAWACVSIPRELEQWNTFVMDLSELTVEDTPLNTIELPELWIQAQMEGVDKEKYTFYVDGIQLYPVYQP